MPAGPSRESKLERVAEKLAQFTALLTTFNEGKSQATAEAAIKACDSFVEDSSNLYLALNENEEASKRLLKDIESARDQKGIIQTYLDTLPQAPQEVAINVAGAAPPLQEGMGEVLLGGRAGGKLPAAEGAVDESLRVEGAAPLPTPATSGAAAAAAAALKPAAPPPEKPLTLAEQISFTLSSQEGKFSDSKADAERGQAEFTASIEAYRALTKNPEGLKGIIEAGQEALKKGSEALALKDKEIKSAQSLLEVSRSLDEEIKRSLRETEEAISKLTPPAPKPRGFLTSLFTSPPPAVVPTPEKQAQLRFLNNKKDSLDVLKIRSALVIKKAQEELGNAERGKPAIETSIRASKQELGVILTDVVGQVAQLNRAVEGGNEKLTRILTLFNRTNNLLGFSLADAKSVEKGLKEIQTECTAKSAQALKEVEQLLSAISEIKESGINSSGIPESISEIKSNAERLEDEGAHISRKIANDTQEARYIIRGKEAVEQEFIAAKAKSDSLQATAGRLRGEVAQAESETQENGRLLAEAEQTKLAEEQIRTAAEQNLSAAVLIHKGKESLLKELQEKLESSKVAEKNQATY